MGPGAPGITIDGNMSAAVFTVSAGATATLQNLTIQNASGSTGSGLIFVGTKLTVTGCTFFNNFAFSSGGALYAVGGTVTITNSTFTDNSAGSMDGPIAFGGAIRNDQGTTLTITGSTFSGNSATGGAGAIFNGNLVFTTPSTANATIINSTFAGNSALTGGALEDTGTLAVTASTFWGNSAGDFGAVIITGSAESVTFKSSILANSTVDSAVPPPPMAIRLATVSATPTSTSTPPVCNPTAAQLRP
jgi:predicted outer membrane repeat protein